ncbi:MAG: hypothetical protein AABW51_05425 [Nanoarchaeota archaeon]
MGGLLTHLSAGIIGAVIIYFAFYRFHTKEKIIFGLVFILGNLLPDLVDFGILGVEMGSLNPSEIMKNPLFDAFALWGHTFSNWAVIALVFWVVVFLIYEFEKISKKTLIVMIISTILILIGILIHLKIDVLVIEKSYWI